MQTAPQPQLKESPAIRLKRLKAAEQALWTELFADTSQPICSRPSSAATQNKPGLCLDLNKSSWHEQHLMKTIFLIAYTIMKMGPGVLCSCKYILSRPELACLCMWSSSALKLDHSRQEGRTKQANEADTLESGSQETKHLTKPNP